MKTIIEWLDRFFFTPASARPLAALRVGLAIVLLMQAWVLRNDMMGLFAHDGLVQGKLAEHLAEPNAPRLGWLVERLEPHGIAETSTIFWATRIYFVSLIFLLLGFYTRAAVVVAWFLQWTFENTGYSSSYGIDMYAHLFLFYLIWFPSEGAFSVDYAVGRVSGLPSPIARIGLRLMQLHLCISYLASAIEKSLGPEWWNGELIWRSLSLPEYQQFNMGWIASYPILPKIAGWGALAIEMGFFFFIWPKRTRWLWIALTVSLHVGIAIFLGLHIFGAIMCVFCLSLFAISPEPSKAPILVKQPVFAG